MIKFDYVVGELLGAIKGELVVTGRGLECFSIQRVGLRNGGTVKVLSRSALLSCCGFSRATL